MAKHRSHGEGMVRERSDGRWEGRIELGWENGQRKQKTVYAKTKRDLLVKMREAATTHALGLPQPSETLTVEKFMRQWLEDVVKPKVRPLTYVAYKGKSENHILPALGKTKLIKLTPEDVQKFLNAKSDEGLSPRTVRELRGILRTAVSRAVKSGYVHRNVAALSDAPRVEQKTVRALSPDEARMLLDAARGDRLEALYTVALAVGLRRGEALGLHWVDIDFDAATLRVRTQLQRVFGKLKLEEPKTKKSRRTIPLPEIAVAALREHRTRQLEERLQAPAWTDQGLVFTSRVGTPLDPDNFSRAWYVLRERAGLADLRFHDLRHACATLLLVQGAQPRVIMETLGHSQISLTMNTYSHVLPVLQREAATMMDDILKVPRSAV